MARRARDEKAVAKLDPQGPAVLYVELRAAEKDASRFHLHLAAFCEAHPNASVCGPPATGRHLPAGTVVAYLAIDGGTVRGALRTDSVARRATRTFVAAVDELHMFDPVVVPAPERQNSADGLPEGER